MAEKKTTKKAEPKKAAVAKCAKHGNADCKMHACTK
tara:strand:+ start:2258 stop:2365 length:108 start_codon:yes stop_codon:yes gene_type:complete